MCIECLIGLIVSWFICSKHEHAWSYSVHVTLCESFYNLRKTFLLLYNVISLVVIWWICSVTKSHAVLHGIFQNNYANMQDRKECMLLNQSEPLHASVSSSERFGGFRLFLVSSCFKRTPHVLLFLFSSPASCHPPPRSIYALLFFRHYIGSSVCFHPCPLPCVFLVLLFFGLALASLGFLHWSRALL